MPDADEALLLRRFEELAARAYATGRCTYTDFLGLSETDVLRRAEREVSYAGLALFGGADGCERVMARFGEAEGTADFPIVCVQIAPTAPKFAEALGHRDVLGALMNLGIERDTLGDIYLRDNVAFVFCRPTVLPLLEQELTRVRHTAEKISVVAALPDGVAGRTEQATVQVASERADVLVAAVWRLSREESLELFRRGRVFVNGRLTENNSATLPTGAVVSVRGYGRFAYGGVASTSRKGKLNVTVYRYV